MTRLHEFTDKTLALPFTALASLFVRLSRPLFLFETSQV